MKKTTTLFAIVLLFALPDLLLGQKSIYRPTAVQQAIYFDLTPPLREMQLIKPEKIQNSDREIPNETDREAFNHPQSKPFKYTEDPVLQKQDGTYSPLRGAPIQNFDGITNLSGVYPPDTQGDVGPNHYVQVVNNNFAIWNKTGTLLYGPATLKTIWTGIPSPWNGTNNGDPVVLYDQAADRWIISQFSLPSSKTEYAELIAISQTPDPTGSWYRYVFQFYSKMPDYPKLGVWPDAYYLSVNQFISGSTWGGVGACALDRTKMLTGDPTASMVYVDLGATSDPSSMLPSDWDGTTPPLPNEPCYFSYFNDWSSATDYFLKVWEFHVDWSNTANSTFAESYSLITAPFNSALCSATNGRCISQPGTTVKLASLTDRLMYRLQYRNFGDHRAMVTNHTVNVDGSGRAGIRWYELRNSGTGWSVYQQGTYSPDASHRWVGSVALNSHGDMALGYSVSNGTSVYPTIRYTGRFANEAPGLMTFPEQTIISGTGYQSGSAARWGDYSMMSVDPVDDSTFWYTTEYIQTNGSATWKTRIASFKFNPIAPVTDFSADLTKPCLNNPVIFTDQSIGIPTSWQWSFSPSTVTYVDNTSSTYRNPHVKFNKYGNYIVSLSAGNGVGSNNKTKTDFIAVNTANPDFSAASTQVTVGYPAVFTDASTCNVTSWSWDFGSGATPATANTAGPHSVTYSTTGAKTISLTINGSLNQTKTNYINVLSTDFIMSSGVLTTCAGNFYDPGGPSANYPDNGNYVMTFHPGTPNSILRFVFSTFSLEADPSCGYDWLKIFDGANPYAPLIGTYCGTNSPGTVTATNPTGSLTFVFHVDAGVNMEGWAASISCIPSTTPPAADFTADITTPVTGSPVHFTDHSTGGPTSWSWVFSPNTVTFVNGTTATSQNPVVQFDGNGIYAVGLTATNSYGSNLKTQSNYIYAGSPGLWTGTSSSDWDIQSNWHNFIVPSGSTSVTLPPSAAHWPNITGDLILGTHCKNLILSGNSEITLNGNLAINAGDTLVFNGSGTLRTEGDWTDYGTFLPGTGTIEFAGSAPAKITGGIDKQTYLPNYERSTFPAGLSSINSSGTSLLGDDVSQDVSLGFALNFLGNDYSQARINTNGWISLNGTGAADAVDNSGLFNTTLPGAAIAPWWDDLLADGTGKLFYKTEGTAPNRVFIAEWNRVLPFYSVGTTARISFQLRLYETTNVIEFCYGNVEAGTHDLAESASIGIKDVTGGSGHFKEATSGSTSSGITNLSSVTGWPAANYRFTPPSSIETFYNVKEKKNNAVLTIQPDIIVNGDVILE